MQEKSFTSLWLGSIMVFTQRTLDWSNSLKMPLSFLCIEVKSVRKKADPGIGRMICLSPVHSVRFALGSLHSECQRLAAGRPNLDPYMTYLSKSL